MGSAFDAVLRRVEVRVAELEGRVAGLETRNAGLEVEAQALRSLVAHPSTPVPSPGSELVYADDDGGAVSSLAAQLDELDELNTDPSAEVPR